MQPGREADHSPPFTADVGNAWSYTSTRLCVFMALCMVKQRDNFTFAREIRGSDLGRITTSRDFFFFHQQMAAGVVRSETSRLSPSKFLPTHNNLPVSFDAI
jgi:hypothetical protein